MGDASQPLVSDTSSELPTSKPPSAFITIRLYIRGKGPQHIFSVPLLGWDADRIDVAGILKRYKLASLYALSSSGSRGIELKPSPRNGLSLTTYRGGEGAAIHLDGEPQPPFLQRSLMLLAALVLVAAVSLAVLTHSASLQDTLSDWNKHPPLPLILLGMLLFVGLFWSKLVQAIS